MIPLSPNCDVSVPSWLEKTKYTLKKKNRLLFMYEQGLHKYHRDLDPRNTRVKCFIKDESYPYYKYPRIIFARDDETKLRVGPILKLIEDELFKRPEFIKKIPVCERPKILLETFGSEECCMNDDDEMRVRIMVTDFTSYERSFVEKFMRVCEFQLYEHMVQLLPEGDWFMKLITKIFLGENRCYFKDIKVLIKALRMSGENTTSLGNGFTNVMTLLFVMKCFGCRVIAYYVEGDDCVVKYYGPKIPPEFYSRLGFTIKCAYVPSANYASFCGQIFDFETLTVIADPIKIILNFGWVSRLYEKASDYKMKCLIRAKAMCLVYQYPGCPILQEMGMCYLRLTEGCQSLVEADMDQYHRSIYLEALNSELPIRVVSHSSRMLMNEVFSISSSEQIDVETYFRSMRKICPIYLPCLERFIHNDAFDYHQKYVHCVEKFYSPQTYIPETDIDGKLKNWDGLPTR